MAITNHERVGKALELLKTCLTPFVARRGAGARRPVRRVKCMQNDDFLYMS